MLFTLQQANGLVPTLAGHVQAVHALRDAAQLHAASLKEAGIDLQNPQNLQNLQNIPERSLPRAVVAEVEEMRALLRAIRAEIDQIQAYGCLVKDIDEGLIDMRSVYQGRVVLLCWRFGETEIAFWHEVDAGFRGRMPVGDPKLFTGSALN